MTNPVIVTRGLSKRYGRSMALDAVDLSLAAGDLCALIGKNGAGKSTLFKILAGQAQPDAGMFSLFGDEGGSPLARRRMSFMIEGPSFFPDLGARANLMYVVKQHGLADHDAIERVLALVGLDAALKTPCRGYSVGMRQRLGLAMGLLTRPDCMVLDEPTNGLDAEGIRDMRQLIRRLNEDEGITFLISSHMLSELQLLASRFVFLNAGCIVEDVDRRTLTERSRRRLILGTGQPAATVQALEEGFPGLRYQVLPGDRIALYDHLDAQAEINRQLVTRGIEVRELHMEEESLESHFLRMSEEAPRR